MRASSVIVPILPLLLLGAIQADAQLYLQREENITVTPDGIPGPQEWNKSLKIPLEGNYSLHLMTDSTWLYLATFGVKPALPYTDVYVLTTSGHINLHASMQLGERLLPQDSLWNDEKPAWNWGNNTHWIANTVTYKPEASESLPFHEQVKPYEGQEFRIARTKLGSVFSLVVVIRDFVDPAIRVSFPAMSNLYDARSWELISLQD